jgi:hypothetical protein
MRSFAAQASLLQSDVDLGGFASSNQNLIVDVALAPILSLGRYGCQSGSRDLAGIRSRRHPIKPRFESSTIKVLATLPPSYLSPLPQHKIFSTPGLQE